MPRLGAGGWALIRCGNCWTFIPEIHHLDGDYSQQPTIIEIHPPVGNKESGWLGSDESTAGHLTEDMMESLEQLVNSYREQHSG